MKDKNSNKDLAVAGPHDRHISWGGDSDYYGYYGRIQLLM
jgi:hypothetical protein